jgi:hypothetical protein
LIALGDAAGCKLVLYAPTDEQATLTVYGLDGKFLSNRQITLPANKTVLINKSDLSTDSAQAGYAVLQTAAPATSATDDTNGDDQKGDVKLDTSNQPVASLVALYTGDGYISSTSSIGVIPRQESYNIRYLYNLDN